MAPQWARTSATVTRIVSPFYFLEISKAVAQTLPFTGLFSFNPVIKDRALRNYHKMLEEHRKTLDEEIVIEDDDLLIMPSSALSTTTSFAGSSSISPPRFLSNRAGSSSGSSSATPAGHIPRPPAANTTSATAFNPLTNPLLTTALLAGGHGLDIAEYQEFIRTVRLVVPAASSPSLVASPNPLLRIAARAGANGIPLGVWKEFDQDVEECCDRMLLHGCVSDHEKLVRSHKKPFLRGGGISYFGS